MVHPSRTQPIDILGARTHGSILQRRKTVARPNRSRSCFRRGDGKPHLEGNPPAGGSAFGIFFHLLEIRLPPWHRHRRDAVKRHLPAE
jgi:hypothetical protein